MGALTERFSELGPWVTQFTIAGEKHGGSYDAAADARFPHFQRQFSSSGRVLELGCLEGGHTRLIAERAGEVVAIDSRPDNIERARFVSEFLGVENARFVLADLESFPLATLGKFDVVFNVGLLYHLPEPWKLLAEIARVGRSMFLWTHFATKRWRNVRRAGYRGEVYAEGGVADPLSGMSLTSFWPTESELLRMLKDSGFGPATIHEVERDHPHGPAILLTAPSVVFEE